MADRNLYSSGLRGGASSATWGQLAALGVHCYNRDFVWLDPAALGIDSTGSRSPRYVQLDPLRRDRRNCTPGKFGGVRQIDIEHDSNNVDKQRCP